MNVNIATQILQDSINRLIRTNHKTKNGFINPSEISGDIIANGALAIVEKRNQIIAEKNQEDDIAGIDSRQTLMNNLTTWMRSKDSLRDNEDYKSIANSFKLASLKVVDGLTIEDADYVEEEIFSMAENGDVEEVLSNYFLARHGFDPLN